MKNGSYLFFYKWKVKSEEWKVKNRADAVIKWRMKNEEWELHFLILGKSEKWKIVLTQYVRDGGDASYILYIWGFTYIIYKERSEGRGKKAVAIWVLL